MPQNEISLVRFIVTPLKLGPANSISYHAHVNGDCNNVIRNLIWLCWCNRWHQPITATDINIFISSLRLFLIEWFCTIPDPRLFHHSQHFKDFNWIHIWNTLSVISLHSRSFHLLLIKIYCISRTHSIIRTVKFMEYAEAVKLQYIIEWDQIKL